MNDSKNVRVTFESPNVTCVIEISGTEKSLTITGRNGIKQTLTGARGKAVADKVMELALMCALESFGDTKSVG